MRSRGASNVKPFVPSHQQESFLLFFLSLRRSTCGRARKICGRSPCHLSFSLSSTFRLCCSSPLFVFLCGPLASFSSSWRVERNKGRKRKGRRRFSLCLRCPENRLSLCRPDIFFSSRCSWGSLGILGLLECTYSCFDGACRSSSS